jgi:purine-cytosine permease-like protein
MRSEDQAENKTKTKPQKEANPVWSTVTYVFPNSGFQFSAYTTYTLCGTIILTFHESIFSVFLFALCHNF